MNCIHCNTKLERCKTFTDCTNLHCPKCCHTEVIVPDYSDFWGPRFGYRDIYHLVTSAWKGYKAGGRLRKLLKYNEGKTIDYLFGIGRGSSAYKQEKMSELIHNARIAIVLGERMAIYTPEEKVEELKRTLQKNDIDLKDVEIIGSKKKIGGLRPSVITIDEAQELKKEDEE